MTEFRLGRRAIALGLLMLVAACGDEKPAPPPPPPPPPPPVVVPPRPIAPNGAPENLPVPPLNAQGLRVSVNRDITPAQMVWNLRSAFNVAALSCVDPRWAAITPSYRDYLKTFAKPLVAANRKVDTEFKAKYGAGFVRPREAYLTSVYNHYSLPATLPEFCDAIAAAQRDLAGVKPAELEAYSVRSLPNIEIVFDNFYRRYDTWRAELDAWKTRWQPAAPISLVIPPAPGAAQTPTALVLPQLVPASGSHG